MPIITITTDPLTLAGIVLGLLLTGIVGAWGMSVYLSRRSRKVSAAARLLPLGMALFDGTGRRVFTNAAADELLPHVAATSIEQLRETAARGLEQKRVIGGNNGVVVQAHAQPIGPRHDVVLVTLRDIGRQQEQMQQAKENYNKLIHTLSHELLSPMTGIRGHLTHLADGRDLTEEDRRRSVDVVRGDVERLIRLTSNLLELSRLQAGQPLQRRPTNLAAVAEEAVLQLLDRADARHITLNVNTAPDLARVSVDRDKWKQVFLNLIDNAIKFGKEGGKVDIELRQGDSLLSVTITDDGSGIAPGDLPHLFDEMFRSEAHRNISGTGLGLAIVRRIVEQHDGQISASSQPGLGTTFYISLPITTQHVTTS
jgi:signal transduction histidine kinase